jgi:hypothetical protein
VERLLIDTRHLVAWLRRFVTAPWPLIAREVWRDRYAIAGDLRLQYMDLRKPEAYDFESPLVDAMLAGNELFSPAQLPPRYRLAIRVRLAGSRNQGR